ncbi:MAG: 1-deoxy-D-xylulose-5-phosphate reductoisomerase, partial [Pseudomonadota bacterium]
MRKIAVLGSTGSIGASSLRVIGANPGRYKVVALSAGRNIDLLAKQIERFEPSWVAMLEEETADTLRGRLKGHSKTVVFSGPEGFAHLATLKEVDTVISAIPGAAGLIPTYAAIKAGKDIALANKETMVMAGPLVMGEARARGVSIFPIDSEHSAILQCMQGHSKEDLRRVILTASGGPLRGWPGEKMKSVTPEEALNHPNWNMGRKISIDSATLMNK